MSTRRSLLASTAALLSATLAGCSTVFGDDTSRHYVDVLNGDEKPHVFSVTITDETDETIFDHTYDLGARTGDENRIIDGSPEAVTVVVDDSEPIQFQWAPREGPGADSDGCPSGTSMSLTVYYEQQSGDSVKPIYGCETVRD